MRLEELESHVAEQAAAEKELKAINLALIERLAAFQRTNEENVKAAEQELGKLHTLLQDSHSKRSEAQAAAETAWLQLIEQKEHITIVTHGARDAEEEAAQERKRAESYKEELAWQAAAARRATSADELARRALLRRWLLWLRARASRQASARWEFELRFGGGAAGGLDTAEGSVGHPSGPPQLRRPLAQRVQWQLKVPREHWRAWRGALHVARAARTNRQRAGARLLSRCLCGWRRWCVAGALGTAARATAASVLVARTWAALRGLLLAWQRQRAAAAALATRCRAWLAARAWAAWVGFVAHALERRPTVRAAVQVHCAMR